MEKLWSKFWKGSTQIRKQRKYNYNAPKHIRHRMMSSNLSLDLKKSYNVRSLPVRKGDTVKVMRGGFKDKTGKISSVNLSKYRVYVEGVEIKRSDGSKTLYPIHPSNLQITKLDLSDKKRAEKVERLKKLNENGE